MRLVNKRTCPYVKIWQMFVGQLLVLHPIYGMR